VKKGNSPIAIILMVLTLNVLKEENLKGEKGEGRKKELTTWLPFLTPKRGGRGGGGTLGERKKKESGSNLSDR